jgi:hypothetical protein
MSVIQQLSYYYKSSIIIVNYSSRYSTLLFRENGTVAMLHLNQVYTLLEKSGKYELIAREAGSPFLFHAICTYSD